jgi:carbamoyltransferase
MENNMKYLGIVSMGHDASVAMIEDGEILFAAHAERYSGIKNDPNINLGLISDALAHGMPDAIVWYERPLVKAMRHLVTGQYTELPKAFIHKQLHDMGLSGIPVHTVEHHEAHAAAGYYTSTYEDASILVCDAIGEFTTISIWKAEMNEMKCIFRESYPHSLGLLYSAVTQRVNLKPNEEEYILMGMAALGQPIHKDDLMKDFMDPNNQAPAFKMTQNVHRGIKDWKPELNTTQDHYNIAASMQLLTEEYLLNTIKWMKQNLPSSNLILMGGVALNCKANALLATQGPYDNVWIMPNPGDAGSSIGAVAAFTQERINWKTPYLGYDIKQKVDVKAVVKALVNGDIIGLANGKAEFGPRSLGNRSILADPRGHHIKDKVNEYKKREMFRPFAPVVMKEHAHNYFNLPYTDTPYMQFTATCTKPDLIPAVCHYDNTSRVQTLTEEQNPLLYEILQEFYKQTGCPVLLNTSLNIKGQPLVNTWKDAMRFQKYYGIKVF